MQVKRRAIDACLRGDILHRDRIEPFLADQRHHRITQELAGARYPRIESLLFFRHFGPSCCIGDSPTVLSSIDFALKGIMIVVEFINKVSRSQQSTSRAFHSV